MVLLTETGNRVGFSFEHLDFSCLQSMVIEISGKKLKMYVWSSRAKSN